eukprot:scaffold173468_cov21-Tisochrysis_lutea.AAC.1
MIPVPAVVYTVHYADVVRPLTGLVSSQCITSINGGLRSAQQNRKNHVGSENVPTPKRKRRHTGSKSVESPPPEGKMEATVGQAQHPTQ